MNSDLPTDPEDLLAYFSENGLGDGLPVIPPTAARIDRMVDATARDRTEVLLDIPTSFEALSIEGLARCSVMAGCAPAYFPAVIAAFDGLAEWENLRAAVATTSGFAILAILHGPVREEWDVNSGTGLFGPGYRANATIGRAINLAFMVVGETYPGTGTMATHTHPGRYTYCIAENEEESAWEPFHVARGGLDVEESAVTVAAAQAPKLVSEGNQTAPEAVLATMADGGTGAIATRIPTGEVLFVLSADHAGRLGANYSREEIQAYLCENITRRGRGPVVESPSDVIIVVAGGIGNYSSVLPTWPSGTPTTTIPFEP